MIKSIEINTTVDGGSRTYFDSEACKDLTIVFNDNMISVQYDYLDGKKTLFFPNSRVTGIEVVELP